MAGTEDRLLEGIQTMWGDGTMTEAALRSLLEETGITETRDPAELDQWIASTMGAFAEAMRRRAEMDERIRPIIERLARIKTGEAGSADSHTRPTKMIYAVMLEDCGMYPCHVLSVWNRREDAEAEMARLAEERDSYAGLHLRNWVMDRSGRGNLNS